MLDYDFAMAPLRDPFACQGACAAAVWEAYATWHANFFTEQAQRQIERLKRVREERDAAQVEAAIQRLREAAGTGGANIMPPILECVEAYATLGEVCQALRDAFGTHDGPETA